MSTPIEIRTLWATRRGLDEDYAEMMLAWDEYSIEANPNGWDDQCAAAIESWGDELEAHRFITVTVDHDDIASAFRAPAIIGSVTGNLT